MTQADACLDSSYPGSGQFAACRCYDSSDIRPPNAWRKAALLDLGLAGVLLLVLLLLGYAGWYRWMLAIGLLGALLLVVECLALFRARHAPPVPATLLLCPEALSIDYGEGPEHWLWYTDIRTIEFDQERGRILLRTRFRNRFRFDSWPQAEAIHAELLMQVEQARASSSTDA